MKNSHCQKSLLTFSKCKTFCYDLCPPSHSIPKAPGELTGQHPPSIHLHPCYQTLWLLSIKIGPTSDLTASRIFHILSPRRKGRALLELKEFPRKLHPAWPRERETISTEGCQRKSGRRVVQGKRHRSYKKVKSGLLLLQTTETMAGLLLVYLDAGTKPTVEQASWRRLGINTF